MEESGYLSVCICACVSYTKGQLVQFKHDLNLNLLQFLQEIKAVNQSQIKLN